MSVIDTLIFDRTQADVARVKELNAKALAGTLTEAERTEWLSNMKGAYNHTDINRVCSAVRLIADKLIALPDELEAYRVANEVYKNPAFDLPYEAANVVVAPKSDWAMTDYMTESAIRTYISDIATLRGLLTLPAETPEAPTTGQRMTYQRANDIEKILSVVHTASVQLQETIFNRIDWVAAAGTNWEKYHCTRETYTYYEAVESDWTLIQSGPVESGTKEVTGYNSYLLQASDSGFIYVGSSGESTISEGVVYIITSETTVERHSLYYVGGVQHWAVHKKTVSALERTQYRYIKGDYIETLNTKGYALPDDQYEQEAVIERDEDGPLEFVSSVWQEDEDGQLAQTFYYYVRKLTVITQMKAEIIDGVLTISGDGSAEIVDGVLTLRGNAVATIENNILYIRQVNV